MTPRRVAHLALAVVATGALALLVTTPAWATSRDSSTSSGYGSDQHGDNKDKGDHGKQYPPHKPPSDMPKPPSSNPPPKPPPKDHKTTKTTKTKTETETKTKTRTETNTKTETKTTAGRAAPAELAKTGQQTTGYVVAGAGLVLGGALLLGLARRRSEGAAQDE